MVKSAGRLIVVYELRSVAPAVLPAATPPAWASPHERYATLQSIYQNGQVTFEEFTAKRAEILARTWAAASLPGRMAGVSAQGVRICVSCRARAAPT